MKIPDIPENENSRLATLRSLDILDTPPEERFDRLTRIAGRIFGVPIALVSLVDENRQWFKSCVGLSASETPRDISFCGHAILGNDVFVIPDARADPRFSGNPLVVGEPHIRFYGGCPLRATNGENMGTLCIIDSKPRHFDSADTQLLKDLASIVENELCSVQLATTDQLTTVLNRRGFRMLAQNSLYLCARQHIPAVLMFIDIDNFKPVNDRFGHAEGDRALVDFAGILKESHRDSDIVARIGGDEFAVLLTNTTKPVAESLLGKFGQALDQHCMAQDRSYRLEFSCGMVGFDPERHRTIDALLAEADALMYQTKKSRQ